VIARTDQFVAACTGGVGTGAGRPYRCGVHRRAIAVAAALLLAGVACSGGSQDRATTDASATGSTDTTSIPGGIGYYRSPGTRPDMPPGTLVASEPLALEGLDGTGRRVTYSSTTPAGDTVHLTGVAILPTGVDPADPTPGSMPVAVWNHPTVGIGTECAPSSTEPFTIEGAQPLLDAGFVVMAPDYDGLGSEGVHPYLVLESQGRAVIDIARAAGELGGDGTVVTWGHSQGGHAALSARAIVDRYAPALELVAVAAASPPTDLSLFLNPGFTTSALLAVTAQTVVSWATVYTNTELETLGSPEALALAGEALDSCVGDLAAAAAEREPADVWARGPDDVPAWGTLTDVNSIDAAPGSAPVYLTHGGADALVPLEGSDTLASELCGQGAGVVYRSEPDWNHATAYTDPLADLVGWLIATAGGAPVQSTC